MDLICPKCKGAMRTYERSGITVDQCTECRGIFLDRGELERLVDAENAYHAPAAAPAAAPGAPAYGYPDDKRRNDDDRRRYDEKRRYDDEKRRYEEDKRRYEEQRRYDEKRHYDDDYRHYGGYGQKKRKKSLFEELFD